MALIALAADKGAPGVTTAAVALGAVWPRPVLLAECDQGGGDLVYRLPGEVDDDAAGGRRPAQPRTQMLNPSRGLLSLAATARRGLRPGQIPEHCQRLVGGLDVLVGMTNAEQAQGMTWLWGPLGRAFAGLAPVDVLADCGRIGAGTPLLDLMREADMVVLLTRATLEQVAHLRDRAAALGAELHNGPPIGIVVIADPRDFRSSISEVDRIVANAQRGPAGPAADAQRRPLAAAVLGGIALDPKGAQMLGGRWGGRLDRSLLIRSAREVAGTLAGRLPAPRGPQAVQAPSGPPQPPRPGPAQHGPAQPGQPQHGPEQHGPPQHAQQGPPPVAFQQAPNGRPPAPHPSPMPHSPPMPQPPPPPEGGLPERGLRVEDGGR